MLWAMFVCALTAGAARALDWPAEIQIPLLGILIAYAAYAIFRLPTVLGDLRGGSDRWTRIRERRAELKHWVDERRRSQASDPSPTAPKSDELP